MEQYVNLPPFPDAAPHLRTTTVAGSNLIRRRQLALRSLSHTALSRGRFCYLPVLCADPAVGVSATAASDVSRRKVNVSCRYSVTVASVWLE
jgi:hypothetical protein